MSAGSEIEKVCQRGRLRQLRRIASPSMLASMSPSDAESLISFALQGGYDSLLRFLLRSGCHSNSNESTTGSEKSKSWHLVKHIHYARFRREQRQGRILNEACVSGDLSVIQSWLARRKGPWLEDTDFILKTGVTLLHEAALYGQFPILECLLSAGAPVHVQCEPFLHTPLHDAVLWLTCSDETDKEGTNGHALHPDSPYYRELQIVELLLAAKANPYMKDIHGFIPAELSVTRRVKRFIEQEMSKYATSQIKPFPPSLDFRRESVKEKKIPNVSSKNQVLDISKVSDKRDRSGRTRLIRAASQNQISILQKLLSDGGNALLTDNAGYTALHAASLMGCVEAVQCLLKSHQSMQLIQMAADNGDTALHDACENGHLDVAKLLLAAGANLYVKNKAGKTPLDVANAEMRAVLLTAEKLSSFSANQLNVALESTKLQLDSAQSSQPLFHGPPKLLLKKWNRMNPSLLID